LKWFELDLPQVKAVWDRLLSESGSHRFLAGSVMDFSWMDRVETEASGPFLFIAEGLLMYFPEEQVRALLVELARRFPGSEMILETIGPMLAHSSRIHPLLSKTSAKFRWGISDSRAIERWNPAIHVVGQFHLFDFHPRRWRFLRWLRLWPPMRRQMTITHLRFR
jgi:O-methyltransferase involved in polyketide biosynthesis